MKKILLIFLGIFIVSCNDQIEQKHNILFISIDDLVLKVLIDFIELKKFFLYLF